MPTSFRDLFEVSDTTALLGTWDQTFGNYSGLYKGHRGLILLSPYMFLSLNHAEAAFQRFSGQTGLGLRVHAIDAIESHFHGKQDTLELAEDSTCSHCAAAADCISSCL